jgi:hypothetical protein
VECLRGGVEIQKFTSREFPVPLISIQTSTLEEDRDQRRIGRWTPREMFRRDGDRDRERDRPREKKRLRGGKREKG